MSDSAVKDSPQTTPLRLEVWYVIILLLGMLWYGSVLFSKPNQISSFTGDPDGLVQQSFVMPMVQAFWEFREYPLWNPYFGGGMPWAGYVYNPGISLPGLVYIWWGAVEGIKVWAFLVMCGSALGLYGMARLWLGIDPLWSVLGGWCYGMCLWIPMQMDSGNYDLLILHVLPLYGVLFWGLWQKRWWGLLLPILVQASFAQAKYAPFVAGAFLMLLLPYLTQGRLKDSIRAMGLLLGAFAVGTILSLSKLIPLLGLLKRDRVNQTEYADAFTLAYTDVETLLSNLAWGREDLASYNHIGGIGWLPLLLCLVAMGMNLRKGFLLVAPVVVLGLVCMGDHAAIPLSKLLRNLPLFETMFSFPKYWLNGLLVVGCLGIALFFDELEQRLRTSGNGRGGVLLLVALVLILLSFQLPLIKAGREVISSHFTVHPIRTGNREFYQIGIRSLENKIERYRVLPVTERIPETEQFQNYLNNKGTVHWYGNLIFEENAIPRLWVEPDGKVLENTDYKGEAWVVSPDGEGTLLKHQFTYNTQTVEYESPVDCVIHLNQNAHPGWKTSLGEVISAQGRLAVKAPAGTHTVQLVFRDPAFGWGFTAMILGLLGWCGWGFWYVKGKRLR